MDHVGDQRMVDPRIAVGALAAKTVPELAVLEQAEADDESVAVSLVARLGGLEVAGLREDPSQS